MELGLSGSGGPEPIIVPAALSLNGNTVTLAERWASAVLDAPSLSAADTAERFATIVRARAVKAVVAVVPTYSGAASA